MGTEYALFLGCTSPARVRSYEQSARAIAERFGIKLVDLEGFACSSGSACKTGNPEPSGTVTALGFSRDWALGSLRLTLGNGTTAAQIDRFLETLPRIIEVDRTSRSDSR